MKCPFCCDDFDYTREDIITCPTCNKVWVMFNLDIVDINEILDWRDKKHG